MTKWGLYDCEDECKEDEEEKQDLVSLIPNGIHWYEGDTLVQDHYSIVVTGSRVYVDIGKMESYYIGAESVPDGDIGSTNDTAIPILAESTSPKSSAGNKLQTVAKTSQAGEQKSENIPTSQNAAAKFSIEAKSENPSEQAVKPKDAEAAAQSAVGDTAAQVKSAAEITGREMTKRAFRTEKLYQGKYELAKTLSNGMKV